MRRRERIYPPNCTVCDLNPSRFLAFRARQNEVEAEYGFRLCVPRRTPEQQDGYRRYMRDYRRRYQEAHREERKAYRHAYWVNVTKRGFDNLAEATGDEETLKRRAAKKVAKQKRAEFDERKRQIHDQYGFWLNTPPRTPEEAAGRARYRKEQDAARKERNRDKIAAYQKEHNAKRREENERRFQVRLKELAAKDPVAAEKFKAKHEKLVRIQHMTHEERVRYRQQKQYERLQAQAERERRREEAKRLREERKAEEKRLRAPKVEKPRLTKLQMMRLEQAERRKEREAAEAALAASERETRAAFAAEREANRKAYLAAKAAMREEGRGKREEKEPPVTLVTPVEPVPQAPAQLAINIADFLPHHPFRGFLLEDTAPTDEELAGEGTSPGWADYAAEEAESVVPAAGGGSTPIDPPTGNGTTTGGSEDDDEGWRRREREEKIRRVQEQYGFTLGKKPVSPEEIEGKKRYTADRARETAIRNREIDFMLHGKERVRKEAAKKRKATIARKKREAAAQAAREAKAAEREALRKEREAARQAARVAREEAIEAAAAAKVERKALLEQAYAKFGYKVKAYENKKLNMRRSLGLPEMKRDFTSEQRETWNTYLRESRAELEDWLVERMRKELAKSRKKDRAEEHQQSVAETLAAREQRKQEREERKRLIFEKYGFTLGKKPATPEEIEGFKRWQRDQEAEYRKRHHDRITAYNREYRRRKRAEALAKQQTTWTRKQWAEWEKRELAKMCPPGSPQWMVREVVKHIAAEQHLPEDVVMERVIELGGLDFIIKGAESMGQKRCNRPSAVVAAARALALYLDPDKAEIFGEQREEETGKREERKGKENL